MLEHGDRLQEGESGLAALVPRLEPGAVERLFLGRGHEDSPSYRYPAGVLQRHQSPCHVGRKLARMRSLPLEDATEGDDPVNLAALDERGSDQWDLPRAWHSYDRHLGVATSLELVQATFEQLLGDELVPAGDHHPDVLALALCSAFDRVHSDSMDERGPNPGPEQGALVCRHIAPVARSSGQNSDSIQDFRPRERERENGLVGSLSWNLTEGWNRKWRPSQYMLGLVFGAACMVMGNPSTLRGDNVGPTQLESCKGIRIETEPEAAIREALAQGTEQ